MGNTRSVPIVEKFGISDVKTINGTFALSSMEGWRKTMEDTHVFFANDKYCVMGIFDGHGNDTCAKFCRDNLKQILEKNIKEITPNKLSIALVDTFKELDNEYLTYIETNTSKDKTHLIESGSTGIVAIITSTHYIIANAGDSRGILIDKSNCTIQFATTDHKPSLETERLRIEKAGHYVSMNRVDESLATSRALGDFNFKNNSGFKQEDYAVTCVPDVTILNKNVGTLLIFACDGVWDVLTNELITNYILKRSQHIFTNIIEFDAGKVCTVDKYCVSVQEGSLCSETDSNPIEQICEKILNIAIDLGSKDNLTIGMYNY